MNADLINKIKIYQNQDCVISLRNNVKRYGTVQSIIHDKIIRFIDKQNLSTNKVEDMDIEDIKNIEPRIP